MQIFEPTPEIAKHAANGMNFVLHHIVEASQAVDHYRTQHKRDSIEWKNLTKTQLELNFAIPVLATRMAQFERASTDIAFAKRFWTNVTFN